MIPGFEEGLVGVVAGETRTLDLAFPEDYHARELAGRAVRFEVAVDAVDAPVLPEIDAELARAFGVADGYVNHFRRDVRANLERELRQRDSARMKEEVMDALLAGKGHPGARDWCAKSRHAARETARMAAPPTYLPDGLFEKSARRRVALGLIIARGDQAATGSGRTRNRVRAAIGGVRLHL